MARITFIWCSDYIILPRKEGGTRAVDLHEFVDDPQRSLAFEIDACQYGLTVAVEDPDLAEDVIIDIVPDDGIPTVVMDMWFKYAGAPKTE